MSSAKVTRSESDEMSERVSDSGFDPGFAFSSPCCNRKALALSYAAGLIEGEGYFQASPHNLKATKPDYRFNIVVQMTDKFPLDRLIKIIGGKIYGPYTNNKKNFPNAKPVWYWYLTRKQGAINIMKQLYPLLSPRRKQQITKVLELAKFYPPRGNYYL